MKKAIFKLSGVQELSKQEQKSIKGSGNGCTQIVCGWTKEECIDHTGFYRKSDGCCMIVTC
ncbi:hypothetical protein [Flavobacterium sp. HNIBRBA15423]|jgi:hypothetical protein|uniref:hypothetical protein n=1 Tax=Flavobacterium sp. HNIBRBA15423 TaxID=3458683 RepID=UPI0040447E4D